MEKTFKITLGDGAVLESLRLNGNNYISETEIRADIFTERSLRRVVINDGTADQVLEDAVLIQLKQYGSEYWFILAEKNPAEKEREDLIDEIEAQAEAIQELAELIGGAE